MEAVPQLLEHLRREMDKVIAGQDEFRDQCFMALLGRGHALLEGVPGVAKTLVVKTLSRLLRLKFQRIQCTSDLMPADIIGTNVLNMASGTFSLHEGPVFADLLLADEVNRMPPRTQAGLLECMEELQVTIDGQRRELSPAFTVFATQNPVEFEGTYPLPEAQLDRFLLKIKVGYPEIDDEIKLLEMTQGGFDARELDSRGLEPIGTEMLTRAQAEVRGVEVEQALFAYIVQIIRRTRDWPALSLGASPRAAISLMTAAKAAAAMDARDYIIPDDIKAVAPPVLRHRLVLQPEASLEGITTDMAVTEILNSIEVPR
ncbi:MAG: MoxR family ATPase [Acidobacteriota bacterium]|jgi:MoxR-like ATPase|nr:MoxR family ATPase [Acidobacteriota bacterium]